MLHSENTQLDRAKVSFILRPPWARFFRPTVLYFLANGRQFIRVHDETLSVVAVRIGNEDRSPVGINR